MIIAFFGPDGSGKTTITNLLVLYLSKKGRKTRIVSLKSHHLFMFILLKMLQLLKIVPFTNSPRTLDYSLRRIFYRSKLFFALEAINILIWILINVKIRVHLGLVVVAERYLPDFLASMTVISPLIVSEYLTGKGIIKKIIERLFFDNKINYIYLVSEPEKSCERKREEELSVSYIKAYITIYNHLYNILQLYKKETIKLDTTNSSIQKTLKYVIQHVSLM